MTLNSTIRLRFKRITPVDVKSERFTFGHRVSIGQLLGGDGSDYELLAAWFDAWHDIRMRPSFVAKVLPYFKDVLAGLEFWAEKEKALKYEPTAEERRAGINSISEKVKDFGTIDAVAVRMHISHDDALRLPYNTVYLMLLKDLETSKFERRLHKVYEAKRNF